MSQSASTTECAIVTEIRSAGGEGVTGEGGPMILEIPHAAFKYYFADRPGHTSRARAAELALDISIKLPGPVRIVWPIFKDFNLWMSRFGYVWDGVPADNEDRFVQLGNKEGANDLKVGSDGSKTRYAVRKVIPGRLFYCDSLPLSIVGKDGVWSGHNVWSLYEEGGRTQLSIFMEHTWFSETMSIEELRSEAKGVLDSGLAFWRDYFIPDLIALIESRSKSVGEEAKGLES